MFHTKLDQPVRAVIRHLPGRIPAENIIVSLQELGYVISAKQMAAKWPTPEGVTQTLLPPSLIKFARNKKSQEIFKLTTLYNIIIKVEVYKSKNGLTQCFSCQHFGHISVYCKQPPRCLWGEGGYCNCKHLEKNNSENLKDRTQQDTQAAAMWNATAAQKRPASDKTRVSRENILLQINGTRSIVCCCSLYLRTPAPAATTTTATVFRTQYTPRQQMNLMSVCAGSKYKQ
jgi:hypothetical protein